ncbi:DUF58 domain-containing protein [Elusimicrobiota bacterium]
MSFLDPNLIAQIEGYRIIPRFAQMGILAGNLLTPRRKGTSLEFADIKPYVHGDDIKMMDWKVYARRDRYYVRNYEGETNCTVWILIDTSRSMTFKTQRGLLRKWEFAAKIAIGLAYLALKNRDACGTALFDEKPRSISPPKASWEVLSETIETLDRFRNFGERTDFKRSLYSLGARLGRRSLIFLISDFMAEEFEEISHALEALASLKHEIRAVRVVDPFELDLKESIAPGSVFFKDIEAGTKEGLTIEADEIAGTYEERFMAEEALLKTRLAKRAINFIQASTDKDPGFVLTTSRLLHPLSH